MDTTSAKKIGMAAFLALTGAVAVASNASAQTTTDEPAEATQDDAATDDAVQDGSGAALEAAQPATRRRHIREADHKHQQDIRR